MVRTVYSGMGYVLADDSASGGEKREADLLGCNHCDRLMRKSVWREKGGHCLVCDRPICAGCLARIPTHGCEHSVRRFTAAVEENYRREQNARVLGI